MDKCSTSALQLATETGGKERGLKRSIFLVFTESYESATGLKRNFSRVRSFS
jgi:hypothetical protein